MDVLVEFCRSGALGPLTVGVTNPIQAKSHLGPPDSSRDAHDDPDYQVGAWAGLDIVFAGRMGDTRDLSLLRIRSITAWLPPELPQALAADLIQDWSATGTEEFLRRLGASGVEAQPTEEYTLAGKVYRTYALGGGATILRTIDGKVSTLESGA